MPIQPAASLSLPPSKEVFTNAVVEKQLLENLSLLEGQESLVKPHFGEVLSNLNEVQSKPLSQKNTDSKAKGPADTVRAGSRQGSDPVSRDSLVKNKDSREVDSRKAGDKSGNSKSQTTAKNRILSAEPGRRDEEGTRQIQQQPDVISGGGLAELLHSSDHLTPICLNGKFIHDTLQGINEQQTLTFESIDDDPSAVRGNAPVGQMLSAISNLANESAAPLVHIEVQAAAIHVDPFLDDQQINAIANLVTQGVESTELLSEREFALPVVDVEEDQETPSFETEPQTKILSKQEVQMKPQSIENQVIPQEEIRQSEQSYKNFNQQVSMQSTSPSPSLSPLNIQGGVGGQVAIGGKLGMAPFSGVMSQSNLERVNALMQVKDHFHKLLKNQESHLKVNLTPESLGSIEITIDIVKDTVMATFIKAERRETMELLARHAEEINKIFQESGLQSNLANMNFSSDQDQQLGQDETSHRKESATLEAQKTEEVSLDLEDDVNPDALVDIKA